MEFPRVRPLIGKGGDKLIPELTGHRRRVGGRCKAIAERRRQIFQRELASASSARRRGARRLLERLRDEGLHPGDRDLGLIGGGSDVAADREGRRPDSHSQLGG